MIVFLLLGSSVAEQVTVNHLVAGSNPARAAIIFEVMFLFALCVKLRPTNKFTVQCPTADSHKFGSFCSVSTRL